MIVLINNRPNNAASQRTSKDTRPKASGELVIILDESESYYRRQSKKPDL